MASDMTTISLAREQQDVAATVLNGPIPSSSKEIDENVSTEPIMKIPNEVWVLILSQLNQKELVNARTVCKKWREVVDAHFEFTVIVHDGKTDLERVFELRIRDCLITRLIQNVDIFQYPCLLRRVRFWGPINVKCFQRVMNKVVCVEELSLTKFALMQDDLLGDEKLKGFSKIKKLELLGYMCKDESRTVSKNATSIFSYEMPDLEKLTINFHCDILSINRIAIAFMEFIARHKRVQNLQVSLVPEASHPNESAAGRTTSVIIPRAIIDELKNLQLNMLRITTASKDLPIWESLLNSQSNLQDLRIHLSEGGLLTIHTNYVIGIPFDMVREPLIKNANTLVSVELKDLRLTQSQGPHLDAIPVDASILRYACNLKRLLLHRNNDDYRRFSQFPDQPNIINLKMLPTTIELLEISRFYCRSEDLQFVVDVLENLKNISLIHTGSMSTLGVHGGIVESISSKTSIETMNVTPFNYHSSTENKKFETLKTKFGMVDGDSLYYDFERFRKGLTQPRPPQAEPRSHLVTRPSSESFQIQRRWVVRHQRARGGLQRKWRKAGGDCTWSTRMKTPPACLCRVSVSSHEDGDPLSRLFVGLDLHITQRQESLTDYYGCVKPPTQRRRRWSGGEEQLRERERNKKQN